MVPSKDNLLGDNTNGTWSGMTGQLQREVIVYKKSTPLIASSFRINAFNCKKQEMDFACAPFTGYYSRAVVELAAYIVGDAFGIFVKYPQPKIALDGPIKTFSLYVP